MDHTRRFRGVLALFCTAGIAAACDDAAQPSDAARLAAVIAAGGAVAPFTDSHTVTAQASFSESVRGEVFVCTRATHDVVAGFEAFPVLTGEDGLAFAGDLLQGGTLDWRQPQAIPVARAGGTITVTLADDGPGITRALPELTRDWVTKAARDIVAKAGPAHAARTSWSTSRVAAREELGLALRTPIEHLAPEVRAAFLYKSDIAYRRVLVTLRQAYYTIGFALPTEPADLFSSEVTPEELARYVRPDNPATYVSSVTYGRVIHLLVQSTAAYEDIEAAVDASLRAAVYDEPLPADVIPIFALDDLRVGGFALGGDGPRVCEAAASSLEALAQVIAEGARISTGTPISYVVRNVARPDEIVRARVAARFDAIVCEPE